MLKRGDIADASHYQTIEPDSKFFVTSNDSVFFFDDDDAWVRSGIRLSELTPIKPSQDPALISGAEALRALADGKSVDVHESTYKNEVWFNLKDTKFTPAEILAEKVRDKPYKLSFRLKPQTIKLELELPKPFEPEEDCPTLSNFI